MFINRDYTRKSIIAIMFNILFVKGVSSATTTLESGKTPIKESGHLRFYKKSNN